MQTSTIARFSSSPTSPRPRRRSPPPPPRALALHRRTTTTNRTNKRISSTHSTFSSPSPLLSLLQTHHRRPTTTATVPPCRASQWLENSAQSDVDVPLEDAWELWEDKARIPEWMEWISSVIVSPQDPSLSRWTLSTYQFARQWEFSWTALTMTPLKHQKIHWRSVQGTGSLGGGLEVANRGQIRFVRKGVEKCTVKLTISYEVPSVLAPFVSVSCLFFVLYPLFLFLFTLTHIRKCMHAVVDPVGGRYLETEYGNVCRVCCGV